MKKIILGVLACSLFLAGCSNDNSSNNNNQSGTQLSAKALDLSNKTTIEILSLKYNRAVLTCSLWSQRGKNIDLSLAPNDSFSLDLKNDLVLPKVFELNAATEDHQIKATVEVTSLSHYSAMNYTDSQRNKVVAMFSPYVKFNYSDVSKTVYGPSQFSLGKSSGTFTAREFANEIVLNQSTSSQPVEQDGLIIDKGDFNDYVSCFIQADIKTEYADQLTYTSSK